MPRNQNHPDLTGPAQHTDSHSMPGRSDGRWMKPRNTAYSPAWNREIGTPEHVSQPAQTAP